MQVTANRGTTGIRAACRTQKDGRSTTGSGLCAATSTSGATISFPFIDCGATESGVSGTERSLDAQQGISASEQH